VGRRGSGTTSPRDGLRRLDRRVRGGLTGAAGPGGKYGGRRSTEESRVREAGPGRRVVPGAIGAWWGPGFVGRGFPQARRPSRGSGSPSSVLASLRAPCGPPQASQGPLPLTLTRGPGVIGPGPGEYGGRTGTTVLAPGEPPTPSARTKPAARGGPPRPRAASSRPSRPPPSSSSWAPSPGSRPAVHLPEPRTHGVPVRGGRRPWRGPVPPRGRRPRDRPRCRFGGFPHRGTVGPPRVRVVRGVPGGAPPGRRGRGLGGSDERRHGGQDLRHGPA
jgi:hypothetical protein